MPINDGTKSRGFGLQVKLSEIMQYINRNATEFCDLRLCQLLRPSFFIDVPADRGQRG